MPFPGPDMRASQAELLQLERAESPGEPAETVPGPRAEILTQEVGMRPINLQLPQLTGEATPTQPLLSRTKQHPGHARPQTPLAG